MDEKTLKALVPGIVKEEVAEFFKYRDTEEKDNSFKNEDGFFNYLRDHISIFRRDDKEIARYKEDLQKRNIRIIIDETIFRISVQAQVNKASRRIQAWATLKTKKDTKEKTSPPAPLQAPWLPPAGPANAKPDRWKSGLKINNMRIF